MADDDQPVNLTKETADRMAEATRWYENNTISSRRENRRHRIRGGSVKTIWAKLDADNGDGTYNATEQEWAANNGQWTDKTNGRVWEAGNSDNLDALIEESGLTGLVGRVVQVYKLNGDWVFKEGMNYVWEATADASSGTITAKRVNADGSLATPKKTFDVLPS